MGGQATYLFLELAIIVYAIGFGWEHWDVKAFGNSRFLIAATFLVAVWFVIDEIAVTLGVWAFPAGGSLPIRFFSLPLEECLLFILHPLGCLLFIRALKANQ